MYEWQAFNIKFPCQRPKKDHKQIKPKKPPNLSKSYRHNKSSIVVKGLSTSSAAIKGHVNTQESHLYFSLKKRYSLDNTQFLLRLFSGFFLHFTQTLSPRVYIYINAALWVHQKIQQQAISNHIPSHMPLRPLFKAPGYSLSFTIGQKNLADQRATTSWCGGWWWEVPHHERTRHYCNPRHFEATRK